ncbi:4-hydroxy-tetrahydrodipicolinate synthase [Luteimonas composti]|uniref:4-hydroxy-tetrahydrodipicolinate synthase n=1 Tax=Luteimonas composti TaxID=398257 RepID=A0ABT6MPS9_9GAMM|nr:4-hydroxy-tetrahydrodipicolinate synthase [Luteimonas composti]MDH7452463.1 4-hydroxy-tetrahydrodipicolinate synthase [Luteimonas composti]
MRLSGSITALATPFTATGELDLDAWRRLLQAQCEAGTQAVVVAGSTGEAASLLDVEYDALLRTAVETIGGRIPVLAGTGYSATGKTIEQTRRAATLGADAALVVTPPYVRPTQAGLLAHYGALAEDGALPIVMYNVPARTGCDLQPATVASLVDHPRIVGVKEAVADPARMAEWFALRREGFSVLGGDDATAAEAMLSGADGVISVVSNLVPAAMRRLCDLARAGRRAEALDWNAGLEQFHQFASLEPNPIPVKAALALLGVGHGPRLPLTVLSAANQPAAVRIAAAAVAIEHSLRDPLAA